MQPTAYSYIRFSTPEQAKGNSLDRQLQASRDYCKAEGLHLDETLHLHDLGKSAFKGKNATEGALSRFLQAAKDGRVRPGSLLLVESLDRLSRQEPLEAFGLLQQIVGQGITLVTLADRKIYTKESLKTNYGDLFMSLGIMVRAYDESVTKSRRIRAAWGAKRKSAETKKLTARCPAWLTLDPGRQSFTINEKRALVVRRIFKMAMSGKGKRLIASTLNAEGVETFGASDGWQPSYIDKILSNRAVLGEFQPHRVEFDAKTGKRKRLPDGEPVTSYYPAIVPAADFLKVSAARTAGGKPKGRKSKVYANILTGLAKCSCGAAMHYVNKGRGPKGGQYLVCSKASRGVPGCSYVGWRYRECEIFLLMALQYDLAIDDLLPERIGSFTAAQQSLEETLAAKTFELEAVARKVSALLLAVEAGADLPSIVEQLSKREAEKRALEVDRERLVTALAEATASLKGAADTAASAKSALQEWAEKYISSTSSARVEMRERLAALLREWIVEIRFSVSSDRVRAMNVELGNGLKHRIIVLVNADNWTAEARRVKGAGSAAQVTSIYEHGTALLGKNGEMGGSAITSLSALANLYRSGEN